MFNNKDFSDEFIMKSIFLYFFELLGISDKETLQTYSSHVFKDQNEK
jgi:hypothetical protein